MIFDDKGDSMEIILASGSPRRRELMALITPHFRVETSDVDERALTAPSPALLVQTLARAKACAVAVSRPQSLVLGCDTVVELDGRVYGKPVNKEDARGMLTALSGQTHLVHTGVCALVNHGEAPLHEVCFTDTTRVTFIPLTAEEIEEYISTDEPYDKAGGYGVQGPAAKFVCRLEGCYFNVMGFPVSRVYQLLKQCDAL